MRKSFKNTWLSLCLLASAAMLGCGGGGGSSSAINPSSPDTQVSNEARAARAVVSPVLQNASSILNGDVTASGRLSSSNANELSYNEIGNSVVTALETPQLIRAVICAVGGNIEGGLWEKDEIWFTEVATYTPNGVYERSVYAIDKDILSQFSPEDLKSLNDDYRIAHYVIEGCEGDLRNGILYGLNIKPNAKITVEDNFYSRYNNRYSFKGTINTDLKAKWEKNVSELTSANNGLLVVDSDGVDITDSKDAQWGFKVSDNKKTICNTIYSFDNIDLNITEFSGFRWKDSDSKEYKGNIKVNISGIKGTVTNNKTTFEGKYVYKDGNEWVVPEYYNFSNSGIESNLILSENKPELNLSVPIKVTVTGDCFDTYDGENKKINSANIKNISVIINKLTKPSSGKLEEYAINDAEARVEIEASGVDTVFMVGDQQIAFNKAKIDVTGLKYDYKWRPTVEKDIYNNQGGILVRNWEYDEQTIEMNKKCFGNALVHLEAEESKNSVTIKADCDINAKTVTLNLVNNGNYIVKENISEDKVLEFNFKTVDINATNVDFFATKDLDDNTFEGAVLEVTGVEKDGFNTTSKRTYKVVNGKLVLITADDKKIPDLPDVDISDVPEELSDSNSIEEAVSEGKPAKEIPMKDSEESLKVGSKGDLKVAHYEKKPKNGKEIKTDISAKKSNNKSFIAAVSFYGNNEFTIVFIIDYTDKTQPQIKGSIFSGARKNVTIDTEDNRLAQFSGKGDKIKVILSRGGYSEVPLL